MMMSAMMMIDVWIQTRLESNVWRENQCFASLPVLILLYGPRSMELFLFEALLPS